MNYTDSFVFLSIFITDQAAVIRAAVVNENQLKSRKRLRKNTVNAAVKKLFGFVNRDNNAYCGFDDTHFLGFSFSFAKEACTSQYSFIVLGKAVSKI